MGPFLEIWLSRAASRKESAALIVRRIPCTDRQCRHQPDVFTTRTVHLTGDWAIVEWGLRLPDDVTAAREAVEKRGIVLLDGVVEFPAHSRL